MESDFNPGYLPESMPGLDTRMVNAAEYSAYQLGQINRSLSRLVQIFDKNSGSAATNVSSAHQEAFQP
jgi:hypothetical protein